MKIAVIGTSNSIKDYGYTYPLRHHPAVTRLRRFCIGKSVSQLYTVTTAGVDFSEFDFAIFDFAVNEQVFHGWGLEEERIRNHIRALAAEVWQKGCLPVLMLLPRKDVRVPDSTIRKIYLGLAQELSVPYFDGIAAVDRLLEQGLTLDDVFRDGGHIYEWVGVAIGHALIASLEELPPVGSRDATWSYPEYRLIRLANLVPASQVVRRQNSLLSGEYVRLNCGDEIYVEAQGTAVGIYSNLGSCGSYVSIDGALSCVVDLRSSLRGTQKDYCASVLALPFPVPDREGKIRVSVPLVDAEAQSKLHRRCFLLPEGRSLTDEGFVELGGLVLEMGRRQVSSLPAAELCRDLNCSKRRGVYDLAVDLYRGRSVLPAPQR